jgi:hypothetical protein
MSYEVWVVSEASGKWEPYTEVPFRTTKQAETWAKRYIPAASWDIRISGNPSGTLG